MHTTVVSNNKTRYCHNFKTIMLFLKCLLLLIPFSSVYGHGRRNSISDVYLRFYFNDLDHYFIYNITHPVDILRSPYFDLNQRTVIYINGFREDLESTEVHTVISAYLERSDHNAIALDWANMNHGDYAKNALPNTKKVGLALSDAITELVYAGLNPDLLHLVGFSLGGQIAGFATRHIGSFKIYRITLLDVAYPGFYEHKQFGTSHEDAKFVDSIHTDAGIIGSPYSSADVDFWPNGGERSQPGCPLTFPPFYPNPLSDDDYCSHWRSWKYWAESLRNEEAFPARKCNKGTHPRSKLDFSAPYGFMGIAADHHMHGDYCLKTNAHYPFGLGWDGTKQKKKLFNTDD